MAIGAAALGIAVGHGERRSSGRVPSVAVNVGACGRWPSGAGANVRGERARRGSGATAEQRSSAVSSRERRRARTMAVRSRGQRARRARTVRSRGDGGPGTACGGLLAGEYGRQSQSLICCARYTRERMKAIAKAGGVYTEGG